MRYTLDDRTARGWGTTLGGGGLFLEDGDLAEETELTLHFRPAKHLPIIETKAKVRYRVAGQGCGLAFVEIKPQYQEAILRLIHHKTGDQRRFPRVAYATQIYCKELMTISFSRDLGLGGMFIESRDPLPVGTRVELRFHLTETDPVVVALGRIRYALEKMGMGVEFLDIAPDDRKRISEFIRGSPPASSLTSPAATAS